jgi:archaellin
MWGQGFLSQTSESTGAQQGAQNQAAQSSIAIEAVLFNPNATATSSEYTATIVVIVRNVGAVSVKLGAVSITGISANAEMTGNVIATLSDSTWTATGSDDVTNQQSWAVTGGTGTISKGDSATLTFTRTEKKVGSGAGYTDDTWFNSGDVITIKVTTTVGTFAQASFTVP